MKKEVQDAEAASPSGLESSGVSTHDFLFSEEELERLGRQRPEAFKSTVQEILFCSSLLMSMLMAVSYLCVTVLRIIVTIH